LVAIIAKKKLEAGKVILMAEDDVLILLLNTKRCIMNQYTSFFDKKGCYENVKKEAVCNYR
jgi:hypothetical protein